GDLSDEFLLRPDDGDDGDAEAVSHSDECDAHGRDLYAESAERSGLGRYGESAARLSAVLPIESDGGARGGVRETRPSGHRDECARLRHPGESRERPADRPALRS